MKKNRPAYMLSVIANQEDVKDICYLIMKHTTSLGIRKQYLDRVCADRWIRTVDTSLGEVRIKHSEYKDINKKSFEYEDLKDISEDKKISIQEIKDILEKEIK